MLEEIDFKLSELSNEDTSCNDAIRESISTVKKNIDEILRLRFKIIDAMLKKAENSRNRRFTDNLDKTTQLLKAAEKEIIIFEAMLKSLQPNARSKRASDEAQTLTEILEEFKNARDAIQTNFEWKYYNIDEYKNRTRSEPFKPEIENITMINSNETAFMNKTDTCDCKMEIFSTSLIFGALIIVAYAILKIISVKKRIQK